MEKEKRLVVGTLKTLLGTYPLLDFSPQPSHVRGMTDALVFRVIDENGFDNYLWVRGEYIVVPSPILDERYVNVAKEAQLISIAVPETVE
jgi:hypothetical protein